MVDEINNDSLKNVAGGFDNQILDDCKSNINATKTLVNAYEALLANNTYFAYFKNMFDELAVSYEKHFFDEAYSKVIEIKNAIHRYRNQGDEAFDKFLSEFENNILGIDFLLRQFCTNFKPL